MPADMEQSFRMHIVELTKVFLFFQAHVLSKAQTVLLAIRPEVFCKLRTCDTEMASLSTSMAVFYALRTRPLRLYSISNWKSFQEKLRFL